MDTALYFPYMRVPASAWFTQVLLYWDHAATIIPSPARERELGADKYLTELHDEGLLSFIDPSKSLWRENGRHDAFLDTFLAAVDANPPSDHRMVPVHINKGTWDIFHALEERGLATRGNTPEDQEWWQVEAKTAEQFMAYLAVALSAWHGQDDEISMFPVTDQEQAIDHFGRSPERPPSPNESEVLRLRYRMITRVLPAPSHPVSPHEIRKFKDENNDALGRLLRYLDAQLIQLALIDDKGLRRRRERDIREELRADLGVLREQMARRKWPAVTLYGLGGLIAAGLAVGATFLTAGATPFSVAMLSAAGVTPTIQPMVDKVREPKYDKQAPLAYAAIAEASFGAHAPISYDAPDAVA